VAVSLFGWMDDHRDAALRHQELCHDDDHAWDRVPGVAGNVHNYPNPLMDSGWGFRLCGSMLGGSMVNLTQALAAAHLPLSRQAAV
jgi:hypothetical protein